MQGAAAGGGGRALGAAGRGRHSAAPGGKACAPAQLGCGASVSYPHYVKLHVCLNFLGQLHGVPACWQHLRQLDGADSADGHLTGTRAGCRGFPLRQRLEGLNLRLEARAMHPMRALLVAVWAALLGACAARPCGLAQPGRAKGARHKLHGCLECLPPGRRRRPWYPPCDHCTHVPAAGNFAGRALAQVGGLTGEVERSILTQALVVSYYATAMDKVCEAGVRG